MAEVPSCRDVTITSVASTRAPINFRALVDQSLDYVISVHL
jgi:hypothetical protein